jgi:hypothetical protein
MIYIIVLILVLYVIDIFIHLKIYGKKKIEEPEEQQQQALIDYTCFICQKKFSSCNIYNNNRALCSEDCKRQYVKGGFK